MLRQNKGLDKLHIVIESFNNIGEALINNHKENYENN